MKDVYALISELQLTVKDLPIEMYSFETEHTTKNQVVKGAAKLRKELKSCIEKLDKLRDYVTAVRKEAEDYYDAQKDRADMLNAAKKQEIAELEAKLAELKNSLI